MKRFAAAAGLLSPASALMLVGFVLPMAWLIRLSLDRSEEGGVLVPDLTAANYTHFARDPFYLAILLRTLILGVVVALITLVCAYPIALFLFRTRSRWRGVLAVLTISPMLVSSVVRTFGWMAILGDRGLINQVLQALGVISHPLALMNNMLGVVIGLVQIEMPVMILALMAGLSRLDPTLEEAAQTLGAKPWRSFLRVTLPLSAPGHRAGLSDYLRAGDQLLHHADIARGRARLCHGHHDLRGSAGDAELAAGRRHLPHPDRGLRALRRGV